MVTIISWRNAALTSNCARSTALLCAAVVAACSGCGVVPKFKYANLESQHRTQTEQNRAQLAEIENLKSHSRLLEEQLADAERDLALTDKQGRERRIGTRLPDGLRGRLVDLSQRYPGLEFDPETGISKLDTDVLFDSGDAKLRTEAQSLLREFVEIFRSPEAGQMKVMVVGHADDRLIGKRETKERFATNWHLSTSRALEVAEFLRQTGMPEERMGVAGFGSQQPVVAERTADARQRNRRVEIFVMGPETPVVGWTDGARRLY